MIKSDAPIKSKNEDLLNRTKFSESIGKALIEWKSEESIVVGLYGKWGSGKSSVINLGIEYIDNVTKGKNIVEKDRPIIIRFNPWNFSEQNQLLTIFFMELAKAIQLYDSGAEAKKVGKQLVTYSKFFTIISFVPGMDPYAKTLGNVFKQVGMTTKEWGELKTKNLEQYKEDLDRAILNLGRKIIIVIDDIDRLNSKEIKQIFQLVKQNANFPNTIYLLSLDQEKVLKQIKENVEFLEKIIQVNFHIPTVEVMTLHKILFKELDVILKLFPEELWDVERWASFYHDGYKDLFNSVRHINRYINSLHLNINIISEEINPLDFMIIEALRVFFPSFYEELARSKDLLVGYIYFNNTSERELRRDQFDGLLDLIEDLKNRKIVKNLMFKLFPQMKAVYRDQSDLIPENWFQEKRVCAEDRFGNYFYLTLPEGEVSQGEINALIAATYDHKELTKQLEILLKDGRIRRCLTRLSDFIDGIPKENIKTCMLAFYNISDRISREKQSYTDFGVEVDLVILGYKLLNELPVSERYLVMERIFIESASVNSPTHFIARIEEDHIRNEQNIPLNKEDTDKLITLVVKKIKEYSEDKRLDTSPGLGFILYHWKKWGQEKDIKAYSARLIKTPDGASNFIRAFSTQSIGKSGRKVSVLYKEIDNFVELRVLRNTINTYSKEIKSDTPDNTNYISLFIKDIDEAIKIKS